MIEIPQEYKEAWQWQMNYHQHWPEARAVADAFVFALAGWERSEFEREHRVRSRWLDRRVNKLCDDCDQCGVNLDPRHTWTPERWHRAVREGLEKAE